MPLKGYFEFTPSNVFAADVEKDAEEKSVAFLVLFKIFPVRWEDGSPNNAFAADFAEGAEENWVAFRQVEVAAPSARG